MLKRKIAVIVSGFILLNTLFIIKNFQQPDSAYADARSEIAIELNTEKVIVESNANERLPMASTTKILTAIIIIEDCDIEKEITVPREAVGIEGSSIYLKYDEKISVKDLLYGLMLRSGNDSAAALAIYHSGSIKNFAKVMNERAAKIGASNSNFKNPSGLPDDEHYTTASDLCKIACYAMKNEIFKEIVGTQNYKGKYKTFVNKNKILKTYDGANGIKTGYTLKAGRCLVSSAEKNGMEVICVVLNCPDMYERSCAIFDKCFNDYKLLKINESNLFMCNKVLCKIKNSSNLLIKSNLELNYKTIPISDDNDGAVGKLLLYNGNDLIFEEKLYKI